VFLKVRLQLDESTPRYLSARSVECCTPIYTSATNASYLLEAFHLLISPIRATYPTGLIVLDLVTSSDGHKQGVKLIQLSPALCYLPSSRPIQAHFPQQSVSRRSKPTVIFIFSVV
jgi:hypothetical protein